MWDPRMDLSSDRNKHGSLMGWSMICCHWFPAWSQLTLLGVGGDGGAHAVSADALHRPWHGELLQAAFEVAVLSLQLLLHIQSLLVLLLQLLLGHKQHKSQTSCSLDTNASICRKGLGVSPLSICVFVSRMTQKPLNPVTQNLLGGHWPRKIILRSRQRGKLSFLGFHWLFREWFLFRNI